MLPKDYVAYRLSGELCTDVYDASGTLYFDVENRCRSKSILDAHGIREEWLPRVLESDECAGVLRKEIADELGLGEVKIIIGAGDNAAAAIGTGTVKDGDCNISLGTSGTIFTVSDKFSLDTDKDDMSLSVLEGVAFALRHNIDIIRNMGIDIKKSKVCGGGTKNKLWLKIIANVLGIELLIPENQEGASLGAAMLAANGVMTCDEYCELENKVYKTAQTVSPEKELSKKYEEKYLSWRRLYPALKGI